MPDRLHTISIAADADQARLREVWESSVRATHTFLTEDDLVFLKPLVREEPARLSPILCLRDRAGRPYAFMFVERSRIEMLFVAPAHRGSGAGRTLVEHAIRSLGARHVDVNEQNGLALRFYEHLGFRKTGRSPLDPQGKPFPILHMTLSP